MKSTMISSSLFRNGYEKFYTEMRNYLWDVRTLELLADVQIATYQAFVDPKELQDKLEKLYQAIRHIAQDDEYLQKAYDEFHQVIEDNQETQAYFTIYQVNQ